MARQTKPKLVEHPHRDHVVGVLSFLVESLVRMAPLCIIFAAAGYGVYALWGEACMADSFRVLPSVALTPAPYCRPEAARAFRALGNCAVGRSVLEPLLLSDLKEEYLKCPWVKSVVAMSRVFPAQVSVEFVARSPYMQVLKGGYYWIVDDEGVMLPVEGVRAPRPSLPVVRGDIDFRPQDGMVWDDDGVLGALQALQTIRSSALVQSMPVAEVVISRAEYIDRLSQPGRSRPRLQIITTNGFDILWGTTGVGYPGEMQDEEKVALLRQLVAQGEHKGIARRLDVRTRVPGFTLLPEEAATSVSASVPGKARLVR